MIYLLVFQVYRRPPLLEGKAWVVEDLLPLPYPIDLYPLL